MTLLYVNGQNPSACATVSAERDEFYFSFSTGATWADRIGCNTAAGRPRRWTKRRGPCAFTGVPGCANAIATDLAEPLTSLFIDATPSRHGPGSTAYINAMLHATCAKCGVGDYSEGRRLFAEVLNAAANFFRGRGATGGPPFPNAKLGTFLFSWCGGTRRDWWRIMQRWEMNAARNLAMAATGKNWKRVGYIAGGIALATYPVPAGGGTEIGYGEYSRSNRKNRVHWFQYTQSYGGVWIHAGDSVPAVPPTIDLSDY